MLSSVSVSSITSITTTLAIGITVASIALSIACIGLLIGKEVSVANPSVDDRVRDSVNAALLPILFAFVLILAMHAI